MKTAVDLLNGLELVMFVGLGVSALVRWRASGGAARAWVAATFGVLAVVVIVGRFVSSTPSSGTGAWVQKVLIALLVLFPYFLYRFARTFITPPRWIDAVAVGLTIAVVVGIFPFRNLPAAGARRSTALGAYLVLLVAQWLFLSGVVAVWLWRAGRGQPTVARFRMRTLSLGTAGLALAIVLAAGAPNRADPGLPQVIVGLITLGSGPLFLLGFAPPRLVLASWRRPAEVELRRAVSGLLGSLTPSEVGDVLLPHMAHILGADGAVLASADGAVLSAYRITDEDAESLARGDDRTSESASVLSIDVAGGRVCVIASPFTPYFGREETDVLHNLASFAETALRRAELSERERELAEELRVSNEAIREFVAIASHDLRTPITVVKGFSSTLLSLWNTISDEDKRDYLAKILRQADHLSRLVDDLLTVSRIDTGVLVPDRCAVMLCAHVTQTLNDLDLDSPDVAIRIDPDLVVDADPEHVGRMVRNYVENARNYGKPPIEIDARLNGLLVELRVKDHGEGVPNDFTPKLFDRFSRADVTKSKSKQGTGLGLSIVRGLAQANGGDAWYESNQPTGACFVVSLPREG
jgi:signal transduction histidine kinase